MAGEIVYLSALGKPIIILNSAGAVSELLEHRGSIYADRSRIYMAEMTGWSDSLALSPYNSYFRALRKLMSNYLAPRKVVEIIHPILEQVTVKYLLRPILESPSNYMQHIRNAVAATVLQVAYGHEVTEHDPLVELAEKWLEQFSELTAPGAFLVEILPILRFIPEWFPGADFKCKARKWRQYTVRLREETYQGVKDQLKKGIAHSSFAEELIQNNANPTAEEEYLYKWAVASFYSGGADTTVSAVAFFFLAMVLYPAVQKKAQEEIDRVVGNARLPRFDDRKQLPYIDAILTELHRWKPVAPLAIPHLSTEDDTYNGYFIPKGSSVIANNWGILHDESLYPSPDEFRPERYLPESTKAEPLSSTIGGSSYPASQEVNPDPTKYAFGYGRRSCPGKHLADATLWIKIVTLLAVYNIEAPIDKTSGQRKVPRGEITSAVVISHPEDFECDITPRSDTAKDVIMNMNVTLS